MALGLSFRRDQGGPPKGSACIVPIDNLTTTVAAAGVIAADLDVSGYSAVTVLARIGNATTPATAAGDLNPALIVYEEDGLTTFPGGTVVSLTQDFTLRAASLVGNFAVVAFRYNVQGIDRVKFQIQNNNAGALQGAKAIAYLQR